MTNKRIVLSSDHSAIELRQKIAEHIAAAGWEPVDIGPTTPESTHYPLHGQAAAEKVASGDCARGIILCGTGQGIMMAANKVKGVRAALCNCLYTARMARAHNNANVLSMGGRNVGIGLAEEIVTLFATTEFEGGRHQRRVEQVMAIESAN